ncbi:NAD(P)H-hydrate dehydratase [Mesorhizobium sp. YIM 152430]|uniref:NAD(P)H-hydrate dehydratase n=1 Tax=Mesorhizobium sp. YIM 152430 TaxID=3031761 RepID=UPI0023D9FE03|nr:NAD(P)H-hydrate dehydratase [Mesorhizobium sp. YIM 152430]MDF1600113.1 NAD(P)H-hydrate dehydratase [Mesorhizobium sp. YIM 152430]
MSDNRNLPALWAASLPRPARDAHKYRRGHVLVLSGGPLNTGAARLSAKGAARAGAGAVTVGSPRDALSTNAAHLTSTMLAEIEDAAALTAFLTERSPAAVVIGPAFGVGVKCRAFVEAILSSAPGKKHATLVLDADAITAFEDEPEGLFSLVAGSGWKVVLTPHEGEFRRLFADIKEESKAGRTMEAARRSGAIVVYKGPDTTIAGPDGRVAVNGNGSPFLATAGSGDVLAGMIAGLAGQGMPTYEAACAAVWIHAEAGARFGPGLIADDLPDMLPAILRELL